MVDITNGKKLLLSNEEGGRVVVITIANQQVIACIIELIKFAGKRINDFDNDLNNINKKFIR